MKIFYSLLIFLFICNLSHAKPLNEMNANTNPDITNDLIYSQDVSDTSEASTGTGKSLTIKNALKAANINVDGTNVGINSVNPTQRLDVLGTIKATAFIGDGSGLTGVSGSGATPGGSGSEIQYRTSSSTLGAVTGSSVSGSNITTTGTITANYFVGDGSGLSGISGGGVGVGTVNPGNAGYITYYPSAGNTVDDLSILYSNGTNIGIGTTATTSTLSLAGNAAKSIGVLRNSSGNGNSLTINAGGGTSGGTDLNGGSLILQPGQATGLGIGSVRIRAPSSGTTSGTAENVPVDRLIVTSGKTIVEDTASDLFSIDVATGTSCGGTINWSTANTDGTEFQIMSGMTTYVVYNKAGTISSAITENPSNEAKVLSSGTLTNTFQTDVSGTTFKVQIIHNSSLTPSAGHPRINYNINNNCYKDVTIL